jgi:hypothetical protein
LKWLSNGGLDRIEEILAVVSELIDKIAQLFNRLTNGSATARRQRLQDELNNHKKG